jgi:Fe-Mn family superoxide dismutase
MRIALIPARTGSISTEKVMNRRQTLQLMLGAGALATMPGVAARAQQKPFNLAPLGYPYEALEPHIDTATMRIHHSAHHNAYVNNLNTLAEKWPELGTRGIEEVLSNLSGVPEDIRSGVRNNLGGHWNHVSFWELMRPGGAKEPGGDVAAAINGAFGDLARMKAALKQQALGRFGSGWAWLGIDKDRKLTVFSTPNQDTPHIYSGAKAVLAVDVWEHAYYLRYQSRRGDYVDSWWNTVNWDTVAANFRKATT